MQKLVRTNVLDIRYLNDKAALASSAKKPPLLRE
jgi:hypothetical protein